MHSKVIVTSLICMLAANFGGKLSLNSAKQTRNELETGNSTLCSPNEEQTYFEFEEDNVLSGDDILANFNCGLPLNNLSILSKTHNLDVLLTKNENDQFVSRINTPREEGEYEVSFCSSDLQLVNNEPKELAKIFIHSDGVHDCASALSADDARAKFFDEYVASEEEKFIVATQQIGELTPIIGPKPVFPSNPNSLNSGSNILPNNKPFTPEEPGFPFPTTGSMIGVVEHYLSYVFGPDNDCDIDVTWQKKGMTVYEATQPTTVSVNIEWCDENGLLHPLNDVAVDITTSVSGYYSLTNYGGLRTENGGFSWSIPSSIANKLKSNEMVVELKSNTSSTKVGPVYGDPYMGSEYPIYASTKLIDGFTRVNMYKEINYNIVVYPGRSDRANAFEISQAMEIPFKYANRFTNDGDMPQIKTNYPARYTAFQFAIIGSDADPYIMVEPNDHNNWDTLHHEYGHYICAVMAFHVSVFWTTHQEFFYYHSSGEDLTIRYGQENGLRMAYMEGLATYLGIASQLYYPYMAIDVPRVGDRVYEDISSGIYEDYTLPCFNTSNDSGEGIVGSITHVLLEALSYYENKYVYESDAHEAIWDVLDEKRRTGISMTYDNCFNNFGELMNSIYNNDPEIKQYLGSVLEAENFSSSFTEEKDYLSVDYHNDNWTFRWDNNSNASVKPNRFDLIFEGMNGDKVEITNVTSNTYTLTYAQMKNVLSLSGNVVKYYLISYYSVGELSGYYYSAVRTVNKPGAQPLYLDEYVTSYVGPRQSNWFVFEAPENGIYYFEAFSNFDTYAEAFYEMKIDGDSTGRIAEGDDQDDEYGETNRDFKVAVEMHPHDVIYLRVKGWGNDGRNYGQYQLLVTHEHIHYYTDYFVYVDDTCHKAYCACGAYSYLPHNCGTEYVKSDGHRYARCRDCGAEICLDTAVVHGPND